jgi:tetratricopeptide (TPR) repeat protein
MPRAHPEKSFEAASRHLFRHVNDGEALRTNPIALAFFERANDGDGGAELLPALHARILAMAREVTVERAADASDTRGRRQYEIVVALCEGEGWQETAARLDLSQRHYYRERRAICDLISRALLEEAATGSVRFEVDDALHFLLARAAGLIDRGFAQQAVNLLERAADGASSRTARAAIRSAWARALISLGRPSHAAQLLDEPATLDDNRRRDGEWVYDHRVFTDALLALDVGRHAEAGQLLEGLAKRRIADQRADEEAIQTLAVCGDWHCMSGRFGQARTMLAQARGLRQRIKHASPSIDIIISILAAHCAEDPNSELGLGQHWLKEALSLSLATGSVDGAISAINGLLYHHASAGDDDEAYTLAEKGLRIAQAADGTLLLQNVAMQIAQTLLRTRYWRTVAPLLFEVEELAGPGSFRWAILKHLQGYFLTRAGQFQRARSSLSDAYEFMTKANNPRLEAVILRDLAIAQHQSGMQRNGVESMKYAVELAEGHSSTWSLCITYEAAARLLKERRMLRLAQQAKAALLTRSDSAAPNPIEKSHAQHLPPRRLTIHQ